MASLFPPNVFRQWTGQGAPVLQGSIAGSLVGMLDHCLIIGRVFGYSAASTAFTDNTVEARLDGGTSFALFPDGASDDILYLGQCEKFAAAGISFATSGVGGAYAWEYWDGYTSSWKTLTVTDRTEGFTKDGVVTWAKPNDWSATSINSVTAFWVRVRCTSAPSTNPLAYSITATGWLVAFTGTNVRAYRTSPLGGGNRRYLRVDDTAVTYGGVRARGYESMTDINTGSGPFPTDAQINGGGYWKKSQSSDTSAVRWLLWADARTFYYTVGYTSYSSQYNGLFGFGDIFSYKSGDSYGTCILAAVFSGVKSTAMTVTWAISVSLSEQVGHYLARGYAGTGGSAEFGKVGDSSKQPGITIPSSNLTGLRGNVAYPNPADGGAYLSPLILYESGGHIRGHMRGWFLGLHTSWATDDAMIDGVGAYAGRSFLLMDKTYGQSPGTGSDPTDGVLVIETSDTWDTN